MCAALCVAVTIVASLFAQCVADNSDTSVVWNASSTNGGVATFRSTKENGGRHTLTIERIHLFKRHCARLGVPGIFFFPWLALLQPFVMAICGAVTMTIAAAVSLSEDDASVRVVFAIPFLLSAVVALTPTACAWWLLVHRFRATPLDTTAGVESVIRGSLNELNRTAATTAAPSISLSAGVKTRFLLLWLWLTAPCTVWQDEGMHSSRTASATDFTLLLGPMFDVYRASRHWYMLVDVGWAWVYGVAEGLSMGDETLCTRVLWFVGICQVGLQPVVVLMVRPFSRRADFALAAVGAILGAVAVVAHFVADHGAVGAVQLTQLYLSVSEAVVWFVGAVCAWLTARTSTNRILKKICITHKGAPCGAWANASVAAFATAAPCTQEPSQEDTVDVLTCNARKESQPPPRQTGPSSPSVSTAQLASLRVLVSLVCMQQSRSL